MKKPAPFLAQAIKVYPTSEPSKAKEVEVPEQTAKMLAIRRAQLERGK